MLKKCVETVEQYIQETQEFGNVRRMHGTKDIKKVEEKIDGKIAYNYVGILETKFQGYRTIS